MDHEALTPGMLCRQPQRYLFMAIRVLPCSGQSCRYAERRPTARRRPRNASRHELLLSTSPDDAFPHEPSSLPDSACFAPAYIRTA